MYAKLAAASALIAAALAQQACTLTTETHPPLQWSTCSAGGSCTSVSGSVTVDANWRWTHSTSSSTNCYSGNTWDSTFCPSGAACATNCCVDGADYSGTYGVTTTGSSLNIKFVTNGPYSKNIGSRLYLMASDTKYQMFTLLGNEFTFDVDVSNLPCGLNGALYFVSMDEDGGLSKYSGNKAGAKFGTGYCDSQCPRDVKFINGVANSEGWTPASNDVNAGTGNLGSCCSEMDIWEANSISAAYTPHPCQTVGQISCTGNSCGGTYSTDRYGGECDPDGCDFNSYRQGNRTFFGRGAGFTVDTTQKVTVVTQFIKGADGALADIKRFYVQGGKVIPNSASNIAGMPAVNSITAPYCAAQKAAFGDTDSFAAKGGLAQMGKAVAQGMVLVMSLWDDHAANMLWLDSTYPTTSTAPGAARGSCATTSGNPADVEANVPNSNVVFSNIKFGPIGSTFTCGSACSSSGSSSSAAPSSTSRASSSSSSVVVAPSSSSSVRPSTTLVTSTTTSRAATTTTTSAAAPTGTNLAQRWGQCGGVGWTGPTACVAPWTCQKQNDWYFQCL